MSYDIYFVRRDPGQSFEDALDAIEESFEDDPGPLSPIEFELWDEVLPAARAVLGDVEEFSDEMTRELSDRDTGIQLSLFNGEIAIHVPIADGDEGGEVLMARVHDLARAVERATGLEGYDPQVGAPVSDQPAAATVAGARREDREWDDDDDFDDESTGTSTSLPAVKAAREKSTGGRSDQRRSRTSRPAGTGDSGSGEGPRPRRRRSRARAGPGPAGRPRGRVGRLRAGQRRHRAATCGPRRWT